MYSALSLNNRYNVTEGWGTVRFGDAIALCALRDSLKFHYGKDIHFALKTPLATVWYLFPFMKNHIVEGARGEFMDKLNASVWSHWDMNHRFYDQRLYLHNPFVGEASNTRIVVNPIFDAPYNRDRNWTTETFYKVLDGCLEHLPNSKIYVIGSAAAIEPYLSKHQHEKKIIRCYDDPHKSLRLIASSAYYFGGDTGMTHFASSTSKYPRYVCAIYGDESIKRHQQIDGIGQWLSDDFVGKVRNDFSPKANKHKSCHFTIQKEFSFSYCVLNWDAHYHLAKPKKNLGNALVIGRPTCDEICEISKSSKNIVIACPNLDSAIDLRRKINLLGCDHEGVQICSMRSHHAVEIFSRGDSRLDLLYDKVCIGTENINKLKWRKEPNVILS